MCKLVIVRLTCVQRALVEEHIVFLKKLLISAMKDFKLKQRKGGSKDDLVLIYNSLRCFTAFSLLPFILGVKNNDKSVHLIFLFAITRQQTSVLQHFPVISSPFIPLNHV